MAGLLDTTAGDVAMGQLSSLPFDTLIGGPLNAAIKAQASAAITTADFIKNVGLQQDSNGQLEAINIDFTYQDGNGGFRRLTVPLLTVLPIPFIIIDKVSIAFKARIAASARQSTEVTKSNSFSIGGNTKWNFGGSRWGGSVEINASYSSKKDSKATQDSTYSVEYTMDVAVEASQTGVTQGMAQILNILQEGISSKPVQKQIRLFGFPTIISDNNSKNLTAVIVDENDNPLSGWTLKLTQSPASSSNQPISLTLNPPSSNTSSDTDGVVPCSIALATPTSSSTSPLPPTDIEVVFSATSGGSNPETIQLSRVVRIQ